MLRRCRCGYEISIEERWNGQVNVLIFRDKDGIQVDHCPGCGEWVGSWLKPQGERLVLRKEVLEEVE